MITQRGTEALLAQPCVEDQHYYEVAKTSTGRKTWLCVRCAHAKPLGVPQPRSES